MPRLDTYTNMPKYVRVMPNLTMPLPNFFAQPPLKKCEVALLLVNHFDFLLGGCTDIIFDTCFETFQCTF